jgi:uncharacterized protein YbcI
MYSANASAVAVSNERSARPDDELARVCGEVAAIWRRACGRGPARTTAHWAGPNMLVVVLENGHTEAEKTLRAAGHGLQLIQGRQLLHRIIEDELKCGVGRIIGRRVETVVSATRLDPDLSAELFLLASVGAPVQTRGGEASPDRSRRKGDGAGPRPARQNRGALGAEPSGAMPGSSP